jgi:sec-independent protein translocase protein TatA
MFGTLGIQEILIVLVVGIIVFGVIRMPRILRSLGSGVKQFQRFRNAMKNPLDHIDDIMKDEPARDEQRYYGPNPNSPQGQYWGGGWTNQNPGEYPGFGQQDQGQGNWGHGGPFRGQEPPDRPEHGEAQGPPEGGSDNS